MKKETDLLELIEDIKQIKKSIEHLEILEKPIFVQDGDKKKEKWVEGGKTMTRTEKSGPKICLTNFSFFWHKKCIANRYCAGVFEQVG